MSVLPRILLMTAALACLAVACPLLWAQQPKSPPPNEPVAANEPTDAPEQPVPLTPGLVDKPAQRPFAAQIEEGTTIRDLPAVPQKETGGKWLAVRDERGRSLRLLPCALLEEVERVLAEKPQTALRLSGETYVYDQHYFLMMRKADIVLPATAPAPAQAIQTTSRPAVMASRAAATSRPAGKDGMAERIARMMLDEDPGKPVLPFAPAGTAKPPTQSLVPTGKPSKRQVVESRIVRLAAGQDGWPVLVFESDNTLQEPPLRVLPNSKLGQLERLNGPGGGKLFYVSGEICRYRDMDYLLLRWVKPKRYMSEF